MSESLSPQQVIDEWTRLTGETWRLVPYAVQFQAGQFCQAGFTLAEMAIVVAYTRKQIARQEGGYNRQSLLWRVVAADEWQRFQERLSAARELQARASGKRREAAAGAPRSTTTALPDGTTVTRLAEPAASTPAVDANKVRQQVKAQMDQFRKDMRR